MQELPLMALMALIISQATANVLWGLMLGKAY
jgi:hypothetical protein